jgi:hypothetical protein
VLSAFAAVLLLPAVTSAQTVQLGAVLNGAQEVPPRDTPASGVGSVLWNAGTGALTVSLSFSGLTGLTVPVPGTSPSGPGAPSHIHAAAPGANGGIVFPLFDVPVGVTSFSFTRTFTAAQLDALVNPDLFTSTQLASFRAALNATVNAPAGTPANLYFNVHTTTFPGGEIRGDIAVVPEPSTYVLLATGLGALGLIARRRRA